LKQKPADEEIPVRSIEEARTLLGPLDSNARLIRELHGVNVLVRDGGLRLLGDPREVGRVRRILENSLDALRSGRGLTTGEVAGMLRGGESASAKSRAGRSGDDQRRKLRARTPGQQHYLDCMEKHDVVFAVGPAGTGKTYLAVAAAVEAIRDGLVRRIVLVRPAVEAGEKLGFLPGDYQAKVDPYLRPLYDALQDLLDSRVRARYIEADMIEVCPLAYMRGRTLNNAFVILDEAQNTTIPQMLMFLTRIGEHSRAVVTGDPTQVDLPADVDSGLADAVHRLEELEGVAVVRLRSEDVVRHRVVQSILDAYGNTRGKGPGV
jgi:phosphate starvation-inducible PhoH-like protein